MTEKVRITVLVENSVESPGLLAEHGLAFWIEAGSQCTLFDTGQGGVLVGNAYRLGISLSRVDAIVLSHGHYDHTGGLADALRGNRPNPIYAHPDATKPKFARNKPRPLQPNVFPGVNQGDSDTPTAGVASLLTLITSGLKAHAPFTMLGTLTGTCILVALIVMDAPRTMSVGVFGNVNQGDAMAFPAMWSLEARNSSPVSAGLLRSTVRQRS